MVIDASRPDWSDVEPDSDRESILTATRHRPKVELPPPPVYTEPDRPILIEDEPPAPPESATEAESTDVATPIEPMPPALSPLTEDPSVWRPTWPAKAYAPAAKKAKAALAAIPIAPLQPLSDISDSRRQTRIMPRAIVAETALDFSKSISLLVAELTEQYQLNAAEQKRCRKTLKAVRVGHKQLARAGMKKLVATSSTGLRMNAKPLQHSTWSQTPTICQSPPRRKLCNRQSSSTRSNYRPTMLLLSYPANRDIVDSTSICTRTPPSPVRHPSSQLTVRLIS